MKFPKYHHDTVQKLIAENGLNLADFSFIKKKGWIHLIFNPTRQTLAYFNKKETRINEITHEWENSSYFKIKIDDNAGFKADTIDILFDEIQKWLKLFDPGKHP